MDQIIWLIEFVIGAIVVSIVLLIGLLIAISLLPKDNVLHRLLVAVAKRVAVMLGLTITAGAFEWVPGLDFIIDLAALGVSGWYWGKLFWEARDIFFEPRLSRPQPSRPETSSLTRTPPEEHVLLPSSSTRQPEREGA